jgi:hypothetical protein
MDPQKNASNPAPYPDGQVPLGAQDNGQQPVAAQPARDASQEVMVDFSQGQETTPAESSRPGGLGNMPSITPEAPAPGGVPIATDNNGLEQPAASQPQFGQPAPMPGQGSPTPSAQDPFASTQPGQPDGAFPAPAGAPQGGIGTQPPQPAAQQPLGNPAPAFDQQQSAVPPVAPVPTGKGDKKTIFILAGVAVVLIVAIAVLILM